MAVSLCEEAGWTVAVNRPFAGALVPMAYYRTDPSVRALMIEVNRRLYLEEATGAPRADFEYCRTTLSRIVPQLIEGAREGMT